MRTDVLLLLLRCCACTTGALCCWLLPLPTPEGRGKQVSKPQFLFASHDS